MTRQLPVFVVILALVLAFGAAFTTGIGGRDDARTASAQPPGPDDWRGRRAAMHPLPPELEFLRTLPADQQFDRILGADARVVNPEGQEVVVSAIPGRVTAVETNRLTIDQNGAPMERTFTVTENTWVVGAAQRGSLNVFEPGDPAVVVTVNDSETPWAVVDPAHTAMPTMMRDDALNHDQDDAEQAPQQTPNNGPAT